MTNRTSVVILTIGITAVLIGCGGKVGVNTSSNANNRPAGTNGPATNSNANATTGSAANAPVTVTGKWEMVGKEGDWNGTVDMVGMDGFIWSIESDGSLYKTDPATGNFTQIVDKGSFSHLKLLEGMDHVLWTVEGDTLYKNDPA